MVNKSETIREWIRLKLDSSFDFSNSQLRKQAFVENFCDVSEDDQVISWKRNQTLFIECLKDVCKEKEIDPTTYNLASPKVKFTHQSGGGLVKITPKPKGNSMTQQPQQNQQQQQGQVIHPTVAGQGGTPPQENKFYLTPDESKAMTNLTVKTLGNVIHYASPKFRKFDKEELEMLTPAWHPILAPILERSEGRYAAALMTTLAVLSDRMDAFKKEKKDNKDKEEPKDKSNDTKGGSAYRDWQDKHK